MTLTPLDLRIGEARAFRDIAVKIFDLTNVSLHLKPQDWEYNVVGYAPLLKILEDKYNCPVIITNGANQALHATIQLLKQKGKHLGFKIPYWNRIPELAEHVGIKHSSFDEDGLTSSINTNIDAYLLTLPNNPDGEISKFDIVRMVSALLKQQNKILVHDAVYYTRSYLPVDYPTERIGDLQIFSASKSYGLSGIRCGYIVCNNVNYYKDLLNFVELSTVGASIASQKILHHILKREQEFPLLEEQFIKESRDALKQARLAFKAVSPDLIELPSNFEHLCGMFAWIKPKFPRIFEQLNIQVLPGALFGKPLFARVNLAAGLSEIQEAVKRINAQCIPKK